MNIAEGLSRISKFIRWLGVVWLIGTTVVIISISRQVGFDEVLFSVLVGGGPAIGAWALAWIIDGFAKGKDSPPPQ